MGSRHELQLPSPPAGGPAHGQVDPCTYAALLPGTAASHLTAAVASVSTKLCDSPLVVVYDKRFRPPGVHRMRRQRRSPLPGAGLGAGDFGAGTGAVC